MFKAIGAIKIKVLEVWLLPAEDHFTAGVVSIKA